MAQVKFRENFSWPLGTHVATTHYKAGSTYRVTADVAEAAEAAGAGSRTDNKPKADTAAKADQK